MLEYCILLMQEKGEKGYYKVQSHCYQNTQEPCLIPYTFLCITNVQIYTSMIFNRPFPKHRTLVWALYKCSADTSLLSQYNTSCRNLLLDERNLVRQLTPSIIQHYSTVCLWRATSPTYPSPVHEITHQKHC